MSAAINGGNLYKPYIVKELIEEETKTVIKSVLKTKIRSVITPESSKLVRFALESVVANGSGRNAYIENYRVGGKTGTAQKVNEGKYMVGNYILSFVGFLPADDPEVIVYVSVDNPKGVTQYGGTVAAPIAKNILQTAISVLDISPRTDGMPKEYTYLDKHYYTVPRVIGSNLKEAKEALKGFNVTYSGEGENVTYQSPKENTYLEEGGTVKLLLS